jgi:hypothetical protein
MKTFHLRSFIISASMLCLATTALPQGTAFTYHGRLNDHGDPAKGTYDLIFSVFDADTGSNQVGVIVTNTDLQIADGLFTATLDFGAGIFTGPERWLEIGVRTNGAGDFTTLNPRQPLTPTPYAIMANTASNLLGTLPASQVSGMLTDGQLPANVARLDGDATFTGAQTFSNLANSFTGDGSGLTGLQPSNLAAGTAGINISGNAATATSAVTAATASAVPWNGITGIPAGFADGLDQDTLCSAGLGLNLNGTELSVSFEGSGAAGSAARSDHNHDNLYAALTHNHDATYSLLSHDHSAADLASGTVADERLSSNVPMLNAYQTFSGSNFFSGVVQVTNTDNTFVGTFTGDGEGLSNIVVVAANVMGGLPATQLAGTLPANLLAGVYTNALTFNNPANSFAGDGAGLTGVNAEALEGFGAAGFWQLAGNAGTTPGADFLGTTDTNALELKVNSQRAFRLEPTTNSPNLIGGWSNNRVESGVVGGTIVGGGTPYAEIRFSIWSEVSVFTNRPNRLGGGMTPSDYGTIAGGFGNTIEVASKLNTISGGAENRVGDSSPCTGNVIGGGVSNNIPGDFLRFDGSFNAIAGGRNNWIRGTGLCTIGGGGDNFINYQNDSSTIGGGSGNFVDGSSATIAGGWGNSIAWVGPNFGNTIGGGSGNYIQSLDYSTIAGGYGNRVTGNGYSVVGGGQSNQVQAAYAVIPGGFNNRVAGAYAFAAGNRAQANHQGAFVWAAGNTSDFPSGADNRFHIYAAGGVEVEYGGQDTDGRGLKWLVLASQTPGRVINVYNGAYLSDGGTWTDASDRNAKENFEPVNPREILEKVAALPLTKWNYRTEDASVQHLGPVAQDFHAGFGLGADDKHIAALDSSGVALAAIQGLNEIVQKQQTELKQKEAEIQSLQKRLEILERAIFGRQIVQNGGGQ